MHKLFLPLPFSSWLSLGSGHMMWPREMNTVTVRDFPTNISAIKNHITSTFALWITLHDIQVMDFGTYSTLQLGIDFNTLKLPFLLSFQFLFWFSTILLVPKTIWLPYKMATTTPKSLQASLPTCFWKVTWHTRAGLCPRLFITIIMEPQNKTEALRGNVIVKYLLIKLLWSSECCF